MYVLLYVIHYQCSIIERYDNIRLQFTKYASILKAETYQIQNIFLEDEQNEDRTKAVRYSTTMLRFMVSESRYKYTLNI